MAPKASLAGAPKINRLPHGNPRVTPFLQTNADILNLNPKHRRKKKLSQPNGSAKGLCFRSASIRSRTAARRRSAGRSSAMPIGIILDFIGSIADI